MKHDPILWAGLGLSSVILAVAPVLWLIQSWHDPAYGSDGGWYFAVLVALIAASVLSGPATGPRLTTGLILPFMLAAALRLAGQLLAINILAALALAVDVLVIALWLGLERRPLRLSPLWLAGFFLFALPLGPILERVLGFPLQMISAELACHMLRPFFGDLICTGTRLQIGGVDILVDLPCSGASGLLLLLSLWSFLNILYRPSLRDALTGGGYVLLAALLGNAARISLLGGGLAIGIDTMAPVLHNLIGLVTLGGAAAVILALYQPRSADPLVLNMPALPRHWHIPLMISALATSLVIVHAPRQPLDRSAPVDALTLPTQLLGQHGAEVALNPMEAAYFTTYGGAAQKAQYGPLGLNIVQTASPLRHLHSPATCLRGMGFSVRFQGTRFDPLPSSVYEATAPDGTRWHVAVSFVADTGHATPSIGEAVWSWITGTSRRWQSVQRITPADLPAQARLQLDHAVRAALDL